MDLSSIKWEMEDIATPLVQGGDSYNLLNNCFKNNIETSLSFDHYLSFDRKTSGYSLECIVKPKDLSQMRVTTFSSAPLVANHENPKSTSIHSRPSSLARAPTQAQDHVMAERRRREKLSEGFVALSALVPNLTKMDKASILGDAMKYMKQLQQRAKVLEEKRTLESVVTVNKSRVSFDGDASSSDENDDETVSEIEARVSNKDVLIRIHCKNKHKGLVAKMISEVESFHLSVENFNLLPFGDFDLHVTIVAQMDDEFTMTVKDLVKKLRLALLKFM